MRIQILILRVKGLADVPTSRETSQLVLWTSSDRAVAVDSHHLKPWLCGIRHHLEMKLTSLAKSLTCLLLDIPNSCYFEQFIVSLACLK